MRNASKKPAGKNKSSAKMRPPVLPYGYAWLEGKLVVDPREFKTVLKIMDLWHSGKSLTDIAKYLNDHNIPTRMGGRWFHCTVGAIIKRETKNKGEPHGTQ